MAAPVTQFAVTAAERMAELIERNEAPWQKPWAPGRRFRPYNPKTGKSYRGFNTIWLQAQGRTDGRWLTYKQATELGGQVRKGEKSTAIQYWQWSVQEKAVDERGSPIIGPDGKQVVHERSLERPMVRHAALFNAEQIDGIAREPERPMAPEWERHARAEKILAASPARISFEEGDRAFYRPDNDSITLPLRSQFPEAGLFYATALHEVGHSTGHSSRLDRDLSGPFGSDSYAKEELVAEFTSMFVGDELGIGHDPNRHASYAQSWLRAIREDPNALLRAAAAAEKATGIILGLERELSIEKAAQIDLEARTGRLGVALEPIPGGAFPELEARIDTLASMVPEEAPGMSRLWRVEPSRSQGAPDWVKEAMDREGATDLQGRWFTDATEVLAWYANDQRNSAPMLSYVDVPHEVAAHFAVANPEHPSPTGHPAVFSRDPETEFYLSQDLARLKVEVGVVASRDHDLAHLKTLAAGVDMRSDDIAAAVDLYSSVVEIVAGGVDDGLVRTAGRDGAPAFGELHAFAQQSPEHKLIASEILTRVLPAVAVGGADMPVWALRPEELQQAANKAIQVVNDRERAQRIDHSVPPPIIFRVEDPNQARDYPTLGMAMAAMVGGEVQQRSLRTMAVVDPAGVAKPLVWHVWENDGSTLVNKYSAPELQAYHRGALQGGASPEVEARANLATMIYVGLEPVKPERPMLATKDVGHSIARTSRGDSEIALQERVNLKVPFSDKNEAKALGAKWDKENKVWYAPAGVELEKFARWLEAPERRVNDPAVEFGDAIRSMGLKLDGLPTMYEDGRVKQPLIRVQVEGDKGKERSGAYVGYLDGKRPGGFIQNYRTGKEMTWWSSAPVVKLSPDEEARQRAERDAIHARRDAEENARHVAVADKVQDLARSLSAAGSDNPYLTRKNVEGPTLKEMTAGVLFPPGADRADQAMFGGKGHLLVPAHDLDGRVWSAQAIGPNGYKGFVKGARLAGTMHLLNGDRAGAGEQIILAEGYATGKSLADHTGLPVAVTFSAGNMITMAEQLRDRNPEMTIILAGDNDHQKARERDETGQLKPNVGREKAEKAARLVGGYTMFPEFDPSSKGSDWNDLFDENKVEAERQLAGRLGAISIEVEARALGREAQGLQLDRHKEMSMKLDKSKDIERSPQGAALAR
ncbi:MAG: zincin-like metallopeptidase domain-containing protein [Pseudonocardiaceae bacterium]